MYPLRPEQRPVSLRSCSVFSGWEIREGKKEREPFLNLIKTKDMGEGRRRDAKTKTSLLEHSVHRL